MKLAYHHHGGTVVEQPDEIDRLMAMTDPSLVFLLYDTGHAYYGERIRLNCSASIMSGSRTSI